MASSVYSVGRDAERKLISESAGKEGILNWQGGKGKDGRLKGE